MYKCRKLLSAVLTAFLLTLSLPFASASGGPNLTVGGSGWGNPAPEDTGYINLQNVSNLWGTGTSGWDSGEKTFGYGTSLRLWQWSSNSGQKLVSKDFAGLPDHPAYILIKAGTGYWYFDGATGSLFSWGTSNPGSPKSGDNDSNHENDYSVTISPYSFTISILPGAKAISHVDVFFDGTPKGNLLVSKSDSVTGQLLDGAGFTLYKDEGCSQMVGGPVSTVNGIAAFNGLTPGTYYVRETNPPAGYHENTSVIKVDVQGDTTASISFQDVPIAKGSITVMKTDSVTGDPLNGAEFAVYKDSGCTQAVGRPETTVSGAAQFNDIEPGTYYVKETKAPDGYKLSSAPVAVNVPEGANVRVSFKDVSDEVPVATGSITVYKTDSSTGKPVAGAEFSVYSVKTQECVGVIATDKYGAATLGNLSLGSYTIKETKAPDGYKQNDSVITVTLNGSSGATVSFVDEPMPKPVVTGSITLYKTDTVTLKPLKDAEFTLYKDSDCTIKAGEPVLTQSDGTAAFENLDPGVYYVKETKAPDGYQKNDAVVKLTVSENTNTPVMFTDAPSSKPVPSGGIVLTKTDSVTGKPVSGAGFTVYSDQNLSDIAGVITTGEDGTVSLEGLDPGTYFVKETNAPDGYQLNTSIVKVTVTDGKDTAVSFKDVPNKEIAKGGILLTKTDSVTGKPVSGAQFTVYSDSSLTKPVGIITTGSDGTGRLEDLSPGTYYVKETKAPDGYKADSTIHAVTVTEGRDTALAIRDNPVSKAIPAVNPKTGDTGSSPVLPLFAFISGVSGILLSVRRKLFKRHE